MRGRSRCNAAIAALFGLGAGCGAGYETVGPDAARLEAGVDPTRAYRDVFEPERCTLATVGANRHLVLEPGHQLVLAKQNEESREQVVITVLDETETVDGIEKRVVEEREFVDGELEEVSRNFFTICREHGDVFYHGEDVDEYKGGVVAGHGGAWRAGRGGARPGLMMPGTIEPGARYYQEVAPGVAMDRAENVRTDVTVESPAGEFRNCLKVLETTALSPGEECVKVYAPGVGMVVDDDLALVRCMGNQSPPARPVDVGEGVIGIFAEEEIPAGQMPAPVAAAAARLHPGGRIREVKRETRASGPVVYALEIFVGGRQYDVEATADGTVLRDEAE